jgi:hypothetical protein
VLFNHFILIIIITADDLHHSTNRQERNLIGGDTKLSVAEQRAVQAELERQAQRKREMCVVVYLFCYLFIVINYEGNAKMRELQKSYNAS